MTLQPEFDRTGPVPIYQQIKDWIRQQILSGSWPSHYKLQAETDLAETLEVSRGTVRKAIAELAEEGLLMRTHGRGTFVAANVLEQPLGNNMVTISEDLISKGIPFETTVLAKRIIQVDSKLTTRLHTSADKSTFFFLKRIRFIEDEPVVLSHNYVRYDVCPGI
ncbi:MAG: GntR family transcriptional regulator, partial [Chloroflexi bacterium]|nr:GntR family transcriptional regulator [Chloroflexota bacterium]